MRDGRAQFAEGLVGRSCRYFGTPSKIAPNPAKSGLSALDREERFRLSTRAILSLTSNLTSTNIERVSRRERSARIPPICARGPTDCVG